MLSIETINIEKQDNLVIYNLNYPVIKEEQYEKKLINYINNVIHQDVISFKDVVESEIQTLMKRGNYLSYINTEYDICYNKNNILSIIVEFSQLSGLYNITYANSYNYDIDLGRMIKLKDIFKPGIDYIDILNTRLRIELEEDRELFEDIFTEEELDDYIETLSISTNQNFYLSDDGIVICFSSYELDENVPDLLEFKILFEDCEEYLSKYAKEHILE